MLYSLSVAMTILAVGSKFSISSLAGRLQQLESEALFVPASEASAEEQATPKGPAGHQQQGVFVAGHRAVVLPRPIEAGQPGTPAWVEEEGQEEGEGYIGGSRRELWLWDEGSEVPVWTGRHEGL